MAPFDKRNTVRPFFFFFFFDRNSGEWIASLDGWHEITFLHPSFCCWVFLFGSVSMAGWDLLRNPWTVGICRSKRAHLTSYHAKKEGGLIRFSANTAWVPPKLGSSFESFRVEHVLTSVRILQTISPFFIQLTASWFSVGRRWLGCTECIRRNFRHQM